MIEPPFPFSFVLVGAGRVGTAVAELLTNAGNPLRGVASRTRSSARRAADRLGSSVFDVVEGIPRCDVVLLGVPDPVISEVAGVLAPHIDSGVVVWHLSGVSGVGPLQPVLGAGAAGCALHPVQACPDVDSALARLPGSAWGVTTSEGVSGWAAEVIERCLKGTPVFVPEGDRPAWHAASVMVSNGIAALLAAGEAVLEAIDVDAPEQILGPLAAGTVTNARRGGGGGRALTGPVVRGETATVERHMNALTDRNRRLAESYVSIAKLIMEQARRVGRLDSESASRLASLLGTQP